MFDFIKNLFGVRKEKERTIIPNFRHTSPTRSRRRLEVLVREPSTLRRVYDEPKKDDNVDLLTTMIIADALLSDTSNDSDSNHSDSSSGFDGGFGGGDFSGGGSDGSWNDSSSSSDYSSPSDSSYDSSSSYDSGSSSSSDW